MYSQRHQRMEAESCDRWEHSAVASAVIKKLEEALDIFYNIRYDSRSSENFPSPIIKPDGAVDEKP